MPKSKSLELAVAVLAAFGISTVAVTGNADVGEVVTTEDGPIRGAYSDAGTEGDPTTGVLVFKGIPFAAPPVGDLRWRNPQPVTSWSEPRDALEFGASCTQPSQGFAAASGPIGEDCLYLNVWTKATSVDEKRPVMVWIHGGAFLFGSGSQNEYNGEALARSGAVVVTVNYRLGIAGFFTHPALTEESPHGASGNQGLHDQLAALHWVQANIANFGGDPSNVTIFGESAGSMSVCYLMATPLSKGLFHRAIGQSGGCFGQHGSLDAGIQATGLVDPREIRGSGHEVGETVAEALGIDDTGAAGLSALREMPLEEISSKLNAAQRTLPFRSIFVDGYMFPDQMRTLLETGGGNPVDVLVGSNTDEGSYLFAQFQEVPMDQWKAGIRVTVGDEFADEVIAAYEVDAEDSTRVASQQATADAIFAWEMRIWARTVSEQNRSAYLYVFRHAPNLQGLGQALGAFHAAEIPYAFGLPTENWQEDDHAISEVVHQYWLNFARTGDPNAEGLPTWPAYDSDSDIALGLDKHMETIENYRKVKLDLYDRINSAWLTESSDSE